MTELPVLYIFGGEKAQGAEIVIERLIDRNTSNVNPCLVLAPGKYAGDLLSAGKSYPVYTLPELGKLNRASAGKISYLLRALKNYFVIPFKIHRIIKEKGIRVVHANTIVPASYLTLLILYYRLLGSVIKWTWSDHDIRYLTATERHLSRICVSLYDRTLVVSQALKLKYPGREHKVSVLYNGLDPELFKPDTALREGFRSKFNIGRETLVMGIAAVIHENKGQLSLISAFNAISAEHSGIKLVIAGDFADQTPEYSALVTAEIDSNDDIIYIGYFSPANVFYNGCDIVINNSNHYRSESLGTSIYEAMACEKIVIASETGGTPEIISNGVDGFLFPADSATALQAKLIEVLQNFGQLNEIRLMAREKVLRQFNLEVMVEQYNIILAQLILTSQ